MGSIDWWDGVVVRVRGRRAPARVGDPGPGPPVRAGSRVPGDGTGGWGTAGASGVAGHHERGAVLLCARLTEAPRPGARREVRAALVPAGGQQRRGVRVGGGDAGGGGGAGTAVGPGT